MFKKNAIQTSVLVTILLLTATMCLAQQEATVQQKSLRSITPPKPLLFVEVADVKTLFDKDSNIALQLAQAPFLELIYAKIETESSVRDVQLAIEPALVLLSHLLSQEIVLTVPQFGDITDAAPLLMVKIKIDDALGKILENGIKVGIANAPGKLTEYNGYAIKTIPLSEEGFPLRVSFALIDNILAVSMGDAHIKKVIDLHKGVETASIEIDPDFARTMERLPVPENSKSDKHLEVFYLDASKILTLANQIYPMFSEQIPEQARLPVELLLKWLDFAGVYSFAISATDEGIISQGYTSLNQNATAKELVNMLLVKPEQLASMKFAPEDVIFYGGSNIADIPVIWNMLRNLVANIPGAGEKTIGKLDAVQKLFNINLEIDLFSWMGNEMALIYSDIPAFSEGNIPEEMCLILEVKDEEKALQGLQKLTTLGSTMAGLADFPLNVEPQEYKGETIQEFTIQELPIQPGYALVDNYLLISPSTEYLKTLIDCSKGDVKGLKANPRFQLVQERIPDKVNGINFLDMRCYLTAMVDNMKGQIAREGGLPSWDDEGLGLEETVMLQAFELADILGTVFTASIEIGISDGTGIKTNSFLTVSDLEKVTPIIDPPVAQIARWMSIAQQYHDAEMKDKALKYYEQALKLDDDNLDALMGKISVLQETGEDVEAARLFAQTGFVNEGLWRVIGPFENEGDGFDKSYPPEEKVDLDAEYEGKDGAVKWANRSDDKLDGFVDFRYIFEPDQWAVGYAWTKVISPEARKVQLFVGSDDEVKVWLNGEEVLSNDLPRTVEPDQDVVTVELNKGENQLLVKVCNQEMDWGFYLRFTDAEGKALKDLYYEP